jgi:hypothetical protein
VDCSSITISAHAIKRMFQRALSVADIEAVIQHGSVIEDYPTDYPYPSCLVLHAVGVTAVHAVVAKDPATGACIVVTVYKPDLTRWSPDFRTRRAQ